MQLLQQLNQQLTRDLMAEMGFTPNPIDPRDFQINPVYKIMHKTGYEGYSFDLRKGTIYKEVSGYTTINEPIMYNITTVIQFLNAIALINKK